MPESQLRLGSAAWTGLFHFSEGTSNKFWSIETTGTKTLVHFGKTGTIGQAQEKEWPTEAAALAAATKLIAEKTKKGYSEQTGSTSPSTPLPTPTAKRKEAGPSTPVAQTSQSDSPSVTDPEIPPDRSAGQEGAIQPKEPPAAFITLNLEPSIAIEESDKWWAVAQPRRVQQSSGMKPFDRDACLNLAKHITGESTQTWSWKWHLLELSGQSLSQEECAFWLYLGYFGRFTDIKTVERLSAEWKWESASKENQKAFETAAGNVAGTHYLPLLVGVLGWEGALECCGAFEPSATRRLEVQGLINAFGHSVLPWMSPEQINALLLRLRALPQLVQPADKYTPFPLGAYLLAMLGDGSDIQTIIATIPDNSYGTGSGWEDDYYQRPQDLILRLGTPTQIITEMRRIGVRLRQPEYVSAWLATTGFSDLDFVVESIVKETNRDEATRLMRPFMKVHGVEAVAPMFRLVLESKVPSMARQWLNENPHYAVVGAANLACGKGKLADTATDFLHELMARGQRDLVVAAVLHVSTEVAGFLQSHILGAAGRQIPLHDTSSLPVWIREGLPGVGGKLQKLPANQPVEVFPAIMVEERGLPPAQLNALCALLAKASITTPPAIFGQLKNHASQSSLDSFVWKLFSSWLSDGAPSKDKWALLSLGFLGGDAIALKLAPLIRKWPGESQHQRAVTGLQVLRMIGTDTALMQLNGIAQKLPFKGLKERARELMDEIAKTRGLTKAQLEDRIVPDCGLDERGARHFDFGPRQFELLLSSDLKPVIREASVKKRPDLPAPNSSDDPALSAEAVADWKLLKKNLREVLKIQTERLEQSMITGRRWTAEEFDTLFVRHPLMTHLSRWVIWACYAPDGRVSGTFRVNDDRSLTDSADDAFDLPAEAVIGIVHPLQLDTAAKNAWGQIQGDYEIISPFPQLGRPLFDLLPDEKSADTLLRGKGHQIAAGSLFGVFEKSGWIRDSPADAGGYAAHSKPFPAASLTAFAHYDPGLWVGGSMADMDDQEVTEVYFVPGLRAPDWWSSHKDRIPLAQVDPIVLSEVLRDLETLLSKAK